MDLSEKKIIMILAPENFRDEEYFHTRESLEKGGAHISTASTTNTAISAIDKKAIEIDLLLNEVHEEKFDAIVFVGGGGAKIYFNNKKALSLAKEFYEKGKIVAAICIAPLILAHAGIMKDKKATIWEGAREDLMDYGVNYTADKVTVDGNIITANGPGASHEFGQKVIKSI